MKNTRLIVLLAATLLLIGLIGWWNLHPKTANEPIAADTIADAPSKERAAPIIHRRSSAQTHEDNQVPAIAQVSVEQQRQLAEMGVTSEMTKEEAQERIKAWSQSQRATIAEDWGKPIVFYGKVIDQGDQPVSGATVRFVWTDRSASGSSELTRFTDALGEFSLISTGRLLQVWLSKDAYYVPKTNANNFDYATGYIAVPGKPVIFRLLKRGEGADLITSQRGVSRTLDFSASTPDGSAVHVDFFNRKIGKTGQMEVAQVKPAYGEWRTATNWSYQLAISDGGFVETNEEFPFQAPESGYQPLVEFKFQKGAPNWSERIDKTFYIAFGNPRKYGRIHVQTTMTTGTILEYAVNPDGSRYLEPK